MSNYFTCPAQFAYARKLEPKMKPVVMEDGLSAHALMAKQRPDKLSPRARSFFEELTKIYNERGYEPLLWAPDGDEKCEVRQEVDLDGDVTLIRVIDAFAVTLGGEIVLIDWKTSVWPWRTLSDADPKLPVPKSQGFQAIGYLIPPTKPVPFKWPTRIDFIVAAERGAPNIHSYVYKKEDEDNFRQAVDVVRSAKVFPKNRGSHCSFCSFNLACFDIPGWEMSYDKKEKDNGKKHIRKS